MTISSTGELWPGEGSAMPIACCGISRTPKTPFGSARAAWTAGGDDPRIEAELCRLEANFRRYQRRDDEALELLSRSISLALAWASPEVPGTVPPPAGVTG